MPEKDEFVKPYPGPWRVHIHDTGAVWIEETTSTEELVVCDIPGDMETIGEEEMANAYLLAAAPDLHTACEAAERVLDPKRVWPQSIGFRAQAIEETLEMLRAALAKANGEASQ